MMDFGAFLLIMWVARWVQRRLDPPAAPIPRQPIWYFDYTVKGKPFNFQVFAATESAALAKYLQAGLDPKAITGSGPLPWPFQS